MKLKEIREKTSEDLLTQLNELSEKVFRLHCTTEALTPKKGAEAAVLRKEIARVKTVLRQRELATETTRELETIDQRMAKAGKAMDYVSRRRRMGLRDRKAKLNRVKHELALTKGK